MRKYFRKSLLVRPKYIASFLALLSVLILDGPSHGTVEWTIYKTLRLEASPLDVAVSLNGKWIFVLTDGGEIHIYSDGSLIDKIKIGDHVDQIEVGPREELLLLKSRKNRTVQVLVLDFVKHINIKGSPFKGPEDAPVTITVFSDFQCEYCKGILPLLEEVMEKYPEKVKIVFKNFPLKRHALATKTAIAGLVAHGHGMFWQFHDRLFESQDRLSDQIILEIAADLGLDQESFEKEMGNPKILSMVGQDLQDGQIAGVRSIPTIFVNGRLLKNRAAREFQALIDRELEKVQRSQ